jgi:hypothetical protein
MDWIDNFKPFICKGCHETITKPQNFSKEFDLCIGCYHRKIAYNNRECISCKKKLNDQELKESSGYWGQCNECFHKPITDEEFDEAMKLEQIEDRDGWEAVQDYIDNKKKENES